jgi:hypothetical protein
MCGVYMYVMLELGIRLTYVYFYVYIQIYLATNVSSTLCVWYEEFKCQLSQPNACFILLMYCE